jgi:hypothetical protein
MTALKDDVLEYNKLLFPDTNLQTIVVRMILNRETEDAINLLSNFYGIHPPKLFVGTIKGKRRTVHAVYVENKQSVYAANSTIFYNPFIMLHEFYHHLRSRGTGHRGSEKNANFFAKNFIDSYKNYISTQGGQYL